MFTDDKSRKLQIYFIFAEIRCILNFKLRMNIIVRLTGLEPARQRH